MISHIKLPVYIFSKRILKNYEWDSIFLNLNKSWKIEIISWKFQRSPYFQYSQWQLTAVMISILLSLNIFIWKKCKLDFLLIDDPIQTLDDLNELSFINLLRYQFNDKQIILSTHEQEFSSFIRYKFWRLYWDKCHKNINVKDRYIEN
jgi:exonuclease SbcC